MKRVHFENKIISRRFFWFVWLVYVIVYLTKNCFSAAMASIVFEGALTKSETGLITAVFYLVYAPLQIVGGMAADRYDPEKLIKLGLLGGAISNLIIFMNQTYYVVLITWTFNAIIQFGLWPSIFKIVSSQLIKEDRKNSTYYISFSGTVGLLLAYLVAAVLTDWRYNFLFSAISLLILAVAMHIITKKTEKYMVPDSAQEEVKSENENTHNISTVKIFLESGYVILLVVAFIRILVANSIQTLSSTMLMETYENVSPSIGNLFNMLIIGVGVLGTVIVQKFLYPKHIKSAPTGIAYILVVSLVSLLPLLIKGTGISLTVVLLCLASCSFSGAALLMSYCSLRFEKFGKGGTAAGILNSAAALGVVVNSYGITKLAEVFDWTVVKMVFCGLTLLALLLTLVMLPLWKRFKKKYHTSNIQSIVKN